MVQLVHVNKNRSATSICTVGVGAAMHMQWGGARGSTFGVHMHGVGVHMHGGHVVPTDLAAYACGPNGAICAGSAGMHMPCVAAYARG